MTFHRLLATRETLHGTFHRSQPPVLWVHSGDVVSFQTLEVGWRTERVLPDRELTSIENRDPVKDDGPALTGPVAVRGAEPGMTLAIEMLDLVPGTWGWTSAGGAATRIAGLGVEASKESLFWDLDLAAGTANNQRNQKVCLAPFLGTIGLASRDKARARGWVPHPRTGGNLDARVLGKGSTLYLPVEVEGGLLSVGDGHAAQGDGEVAGTAIECPMENAEVRLTLHSDGTPTPTPRAKTVEGWVTFGVGPTLEEAARLALNSMLDLVVEKTLLNRSQALAWASAVVDLRITQMVNPLMGVHAVLRDPLR